MSVRDTGWIGDETRQRRDIDGRWGLWVAASAGRWFAGIAFTGADDWCPVMESIECADLDAAKRAAEDALRQLCRDTLKALGEP